MPALSRLPALPSSSKLSRTHHGRATANKEIILFNSLNDRLPSRADCLINQIFKTISKYSRREAESRTPLSYPPTGRFRYTSSLFLLTSYLLHLTSYFFPQPSTIRNTADLVVKYSCLFPVLVVSAPLLVIFPQII